MELIIIAGRVGQDASIKESNGNQFTAFSLAVDDSYKTQDGTKVERTNWYSCIKNGTGLAPYIKKGQYLTVTGKPQPKLFKDNQGQAQIGLNVSVHSVSLGPNPGGSAPDQLHNPAAYPVSTHSPNSAMVTAQPSITDFPDSGNDTDLPF